MTIEINNESGCCNGVERAIKKAEEYLNSHKVLYSLGSIVHNNVEINRLSELGLKTIDIQTYSKMQGETVLIRAHGEPPSTYDIAHDNGLNIIDCTCPVVLRLQEKVAASYKEIKSEGGQVIIFGKKGHAEVLGIIGQVNGDALIIQSLAELKALLEQNVLDLNRAIHIFSQTTKDPSEYQEVCEFLNNKIKEFKGASSNLRITNSVCRQVSSRNASLINFALNKSIIIFVSGKESSNGYALYELCRQHNPRSYIIEAIDELKDEWFTQDDHVGICGATSTPKWQLEKVLEAIKNI